jgi:hypothetical protein
VVRELLPRNRWLAWGAFAGAFFGAGYSSVVCLFGGDSGVAPAALTISGGLGAVIGVIFADRYRAAFPSETNLCMWPGMLLGSIPVLGVLIRPQAPRLVLASNPS